MDVTLFPPYICGDFKCIRCGSTVSDCIQTKLLHVTTQNSSRQYRVGDEVAIDGLEDYVEMLPWDGANPLRIVIGDWSCDVCGLNYQWAIITFYTGDGSHSQPFKAIVNSVETFIPSEITFSNVDYIEAALAELSYFPDNPLNATAIFRGLPIEQKVDAVVKGYKRWGPGGSRVVKKLYAVKKA